jgi:isopentenyl diphosphate isomerase/L-lactate dehydrogenase-like FMN-dependent dehydrogenase
MVWLDGEVALARAAADAGQVGASRALEILQQEILHTLAMTGCINPDEVGQDICGEMTRQRRSLDNLF